MSGSSTSGLHVLVVDDSAVHLKLLEYTLSREFDVVHQARNGHEAMEIFERLMAFLPVGCADALTL